MKIKFFLLSIVLTSAALEARVEDPLKKVETKNIDTKVADVDKSKESFQLRTPTTIQNDITNLFNILQTSTDDSGYAAANSLLIAYKTIPVGMTLVLSARRTFNGVINSTPLHAAVRGSNAGITALLFQKASFVGSAYSPTLYSEMANAVDGMNKKPIDWTTPGSDIYNFLLSYTTP